MEATTATQVVLVPGAIEAPGGRPGDGQPVVLAGGPLRARLGQPGAATDAATDAAATGAGAATNALGRQPGAGAGAPPAPAGTVLAPAGSGPTPGVIPDLMATPVFAELKMPEPQASPDLPQRTSALGQPGRPGQPGQPGQPGRPGADHGGGSAVPWRSRRGVLLLAAAAAVIVVIAGVWIAFPGLTASLAQNFDQPSRSTTGTAGPSSGPTSQASHPGTKGHSSGPGSGTGSPAPSGGHTPSGKHTQSGKPSPSGTPRPSSTPSPSATPSPSPSPSPSSSGSGGSTPPPPGYVWQSVTAASIGTRAGFRLAAPASWVMTPGLVTTIRPVLGGARLRINLNPWAMPGPVGEARRLQAAAIATGRYPHYHLASILAITFHGHPAATWVFWWRPPASLVRINVAEVIFHAGALAGHQPYVLSMSAPATRAGWASGIFRVALRTFKPLPAPGPAS